MRKITFNVILFFFPAIFVFAQFEPVRNFSVKDGLPSGIVYDCLQDKQGFMWFATAAGLARFDGTNFKVFTTEHGLTNNEILQVGLDKDGSIWILPFGTTPCIYDPATQKIYNEGNYPELKKLKNLRTQLLMRNSALGLVGYSLWQVFFFENKRISSINVTNMNDIWLINRDSIIFRLNQGYLATGISKINYLLTGGKEFILDFAGPESATEFSRNPDWGSWKLFNDTRLTKLSLCQYTEGSVKQRATFVSRYAINSIIKHVDKIYVPTVNGVYVTDTLLASTEYFFPGKNISRVFVDKDKNEWLCSLSGEGVYMRLKNKVKQYDVSSGLISNNIISLKIQANNRLLCGDDKGNIYEIDLNKQTPRPSLLNKLPQAVRNIELYGKSFVAYSNYEILLNGKKVPYDSGAIKTVIQGANGKLLIGSHVNLYYFNVSDNSIELIKHNERFTTLCYNEGKLYYGNNNGLFQIQNIHPFERQPVNNVSEILRKPINHLLSTKEGILWVATNGNGVVAIKNEKIIGRFDMMSTPSITSNICKKMFYDEEDNSIWIATNVGLNKISYTLFKDSLSSVINSINSSEGLNDEDVNDLCVKDGKVYVATIKGICIFNTKLSKLPVPIKITDVIIKNYSLRDSTVSVQSKYDLKYWQNNISISYAGICFTCDKKPVYQYRMIGAGADSSWKSTTANTVEFGELRKGNHTFQVRSNKDNIQELNFDIQPAFWQTKWFYALVGIGIIGIFFFSIKFIARQIRKKEFEKTAINKKFAELEFQALQAQMNPHFVFNAMSTLQYYILKNESENASEYLAKFARLMRLFLESSRNKFIELRKEIELLRSYVELEQARLEHSFQYQINIDPEVEMDTKIPSVMIQPFVENAILHGLRHKNDGVGLLKLQFSASDHVLECRIQDNGIGREESAMINKAKDKLYKSQALNIIDEKVRALKEINNVDIKIATEDNVKEDGKGAGTTVTILFELNN